MTLQDLKELARKANDDGQPIEWQIEAEKNFADALRRIGVELLELWEACDTEQFHCCLGDIAEEALDALNSKAASMDA